MRGAAIAVTLILASCASGAPPMPASHPLPVNLQIAPAQLQPPQALPAPAGADDMSLLRNHVAVAHAYHALADQVRALLCTLARSEGIQVNASAPTLAVPCDQPQ